MLVKLTDSTGACQVFILSNETKIGSILVTTKCPQK